MNQHAEPVFFAGRGGEPSRARVAAPFAWRISSLARPVAAACRFTVVDYLSAGRAVAQVTLVAAT
eukprot:12622010-Alexandrium_andersonii.AAC.1